MKIEIDVREDEIKDICDKAVRNKINEHIMSKLSDWRFENDHKDTVYKIFDSTVKEIAKEILSNQDTIRAKCEDILSRKISAQLQRLIKAG